MLRPDFGENLEIQPFLKSTIHVMTERRGHESVASSMGGSVCDGLEFIEVLTDSWEAN